MTFAWKEPGALMSDGSWNPEAVHESALDRFVQSLCRARRASQLSPATLGSQIESSAFSGAFRSLPGWLEISSWEGWAHVQTLNAAEEAVKRMGYGTGTVGDHHGHWEGGDWMHGRDERPLVKAQSEPIANLLSSLMEKP